MGYGLITLNTLRIANIFLRASSTCVFTGYSISKQLGMAPSNGVVWGSLKHLESRGWLRSDLVDSDSVTRRLYSITRDGRESLTSMLAGLQMPSTVQSIQRSA